MVNEYIKALMLILVAEMGDKTQILALAFATRYKALKVLFGVFIGVLLNHLVAVIAGIWLSNVVPLNYVRIISAFAFIIFGLWTLKYDDKEENQEGVFKFGPVLTVAAAFFIGELGDKTQLTALTLSTTSPYPIFILAGTVTGMMIISGLGIIVGAKIGNKIPETFIKFISSFVFILFGIINLSKSVPGRYVNAINIFLFTCIIIIISLLIIRSNIKKSKRKNWGRF